MSFALGVLTPAAISTQFGGLSFIALGLGLAFFPSAWNALGDLSKERPAVEPGTMTYRPYGLESPWNARKLSKAGSTRGLATGRREAVSTGRSVISAPGVDFEVAHRGSDGQPLAVVEDDQPARSNEFA